MGESPRCHLLALPRELRDEIWSYAVLNEHHLFLPEDSPPYQWIDIRGDGWRPLQSLSYRTPALLQTCRLIRKEYMDLYYPTVHFRFDELPTCLKFLRSLDPAARSKPASLRWCGCFGAYIKPQDEDLDADEKIMIWGLARWGKIVDWFGERGVDVSGALRVCAGWCAKEKGKGVESWFGRESGAASGVKAFGWFDSDGRRSAWFDGI